MPPHRSWSSTYRLSSESRQQRILRTVHRLDDPGIVALGTTRDTRPAVVIECSSANAEFRARRIVHTLDLLAERIETSRASGLCAPEPPQSTHLAGLPIPRRLTRLVPTDRLRRLL
ncbi:hypothetical protein C6I20_11485 [Aeromicrobium sp. A1-2]|uniref:hypothetical protein n=1 Tax=Aeromicrobium sp. A1-2 TaxID=2107713 RepID=UPI000E49F2A3|nr:hypothetical protein [Aeromicrobium sp. A1-2]AXT85749.1 hypothetical protein C6I20_11485 [Aeromicrobium sp. A1-2]